MCARLYMCVFYVHCVYIFIKQRCVRRVSGSISGPGLACLWDSRLLFCPGAAKAVDPTSFTLCQPAVPVLLPTQGASCLLLLVSLLFWGLKGHETPLAPPHADSGSDEGLVHPGKKLSAVRCGSQRLVSPSSESDCPGMQQFRQVTTVLATQWWPVWTWTFALPWTSVPCLTPAPWVAFLPMGSTELLPGAPSRRSGWPGGSADAL